MFWTYFIAVCNGLSNGTLAWMGWRVTNVDKPLSKRQRRIYDVLFVVFLVLSTVLICLSVSRGLPERAHLKLQPDLGVTFPAGVTDIWSRASEFLPVGSPLKLNVDYKNVGNGPATNATHTGRVYIEPDYSLASSRDVISKLDSWLKVEATLPKTTIARDETGITTFEGDSLTPEDFQSILHGRRFVYEVGTFWFDDDLGGHYHNFCWLLREPREGGIIMFQECDEHSDEK